MKKNFKRLLAAVLCSCSLSMVSYAGSWQAEGNNWRYQNDDASYAANGWIADSGKWYYFDASGYMKTGWILDQNNWFYLNPTGEMRQEPLTENQLTYYFDSVSGICTNPDGTPVVTSSPYTTEEQQYIDSIDQFIFLLSDAANNTMTEMENLEKEDVEEAKRILHELKVPFQQLIQIQAPARFSEAHERYKSGCRIVIEYLDICIQLVDSDSTNITEDQALELFSKMMSSMTTSEKEFNAGDSLLQASM